MEKKQIMVIDDNVTNLNITRTALEKDYKVLLIPKGEKAIEIIKKKSPNLILLDIVMPHINGFELIQEIKALPSPLNEIPIIFLTSQNDTDSEFEGFELGAVDYIIKPFSSLLLLKRVKLHIKLDEQRKMLREYSRTLESNVKDLENKNAMNNTILKCVKTLATEDTIDVSMNQLLKNITDYYAGISTKILYIDKSSSNLNLSYSYTIGSDKDIPKFDVFNLEVAIEMFNKYNTDGVGYISNASQILDLPVTSDIFKENPINEIIFVPLVLQSQIVGFLVVINPSKNLDDAIMIKTISSFIVNHINKDNLLIKLERLSYTDDLTNLYNRNCYNKFISEYKPCPNNKIGVIFGDVNGLKFANDNHGHEFGDTLIKANADFLNNYIDGLIFRIGGDEFVCILEGINKEDFYKTITKLKDDIKNSNEINISIGETWAENFDSLEKVIYFADKDMYDNKQKYYADKS